MRLPEVLRRRDPHVHKTHFGHVLILAGSRHMLGASALCGLAAMRSGAGMVTCGVPASLNEALHKKLSAVIMTLALKETQEQTMSLSAAAQIFKSGLHYNTIAIGPGLSRHPQTQAFVLKIIKNATVPLVIDADGLNAIAPALKSLTKTHTEKILTPHPGEMTRLTGLKKSVIEKCRQKVARDFACRYRCVLLLKGHRSLVASPDGRTYLNRTGNAGMATAGSGDVLTGMIAAFLAQGLSGFEAAQWGTYLHGRAGDLAARDKPMASLIATDIIEFIPHALRATT